MNTVKTYQKVNSQKESVSFSISKMEDIYTKRNGKADEPHRHHFYTVLIINKAIGLHKIDFNTYNLASKQIFFVAPGQVHQVIETEKSLGFAMTFSNQFLVENSIPLSFIASLNLFQNYGQTPPLLPNQDQFNTIENFSNQIFTLFRSDAKMKDLSIGAFLKLLLIECNNICAMNPIESDVDTSGDNLIRAFKSLVDDNYKKEHSTSYYATKLHITPDHLNRTVKSKIGKTAKEYIQSRIITEAKRLLYFTDSSSKEIGYELGYNEPANFSAFFKKHTLLSPSNFKKNEIQS
ncbi:AraC family transcriptional regulator [Arcticibacterium luteifluviistationis]|uniref:Transcriptional regulator n=1 Tax=Arcticibacterium luteifluviistationis TaxID=1784714 RepID=A0A2Z4G8J4_9BACT|nr:helix-turn-helix domain-containing protein [Arcticibacterium luteifluviistationis]AWV97425.1 transcriptional regulator [Arcticibacterium luteifluviistationis]